MPRVRVEIPQICCVEGLSDGKHLPVLGCLRPLDPYAITKLPRDFDRLIKKPDFKVYLPKACHA